MRNRHLISMTCLLLIAAASLAGARTGDFQPDAKAVRRFESAYRYPQAGWIVLHIQGEPYERGVQHGRLMASEIAAHIRCFAAFYSAEGPDDAWKLIRTIADVAFLRGFDREYLEEMQGIADGATAAGARFDNRALDLLDIAALNLWPEVMTLEWALKATPTGLEGVKYPDVPRQPPSTPQASRCSAFAATGPATADGKIVFGHITMFALYPSTFYNVWLDVQPSEGHRVLMQSYPGGIQSGMDYYLNSVGILVAETTIDQTQFNSAGTPLTSRIRKALQYGDSIDEVVEVLKTANNGLYTNEWLIADTKTNEIAMFELGTNATKLYRSSENEWFGGTEGFYWGCNNTKDLAVRLDTIGATNDRPANMVWTPHVRDVAWVDLYHKHKGKIGVDFAREAFTNPPICAYPSVDAKFTTTELAKDLKSWALFGPPMGRTWEPTQQERREFREIRPLVSNPWALLHGVAPSAEAAGSEAVDLVDEEEFFDEREEREREREKEERRPPRKVVWRGTLLPKSDADIWLAAAFADYHEIVDRERGMLAESKNNCLCETDLDKAATSLYAARARYLRSAAVIGDVPLSKTTADPVHAEWYLIASGKGVLVLHELRRMLGDDRFIEMMDSFGLEHAGREVSSAQFIIHAERVTGKKLGEFFDYWLNKTGLPKLKLVDAALSPAAASGSGSASHRIEGKIVAEVGPLPSTIEVTVEVGDDETTKTVDVDSSTGAFRVETDGTPTRITIDRYGRIAKANGGSFDVQCFVAELDKALIVYGATDEAAANREAAEALQKKLRAAWYNYTVPIKSDAEATDAELRGHNLVLIGRPSTNQVTERVRKAFPVAFDTQSFTVRGDTYAHMDSAVIAAGRNPLNERYSVTVLAGLSAAATYRGVSGFGGSNSGVEVKILPHGRKPISLVAPATELIKDLGNR